ncbi:MAG TPA: methylthioribulose 1-phosphate dehydratase [Candidatus Angelobacter sp.]|nr:methylthioribulose 1-phosphate dehydratase [Candidatus Angelobacter sp.]
MATSALAKTRASQSRAKIDLAAAAGELTSVGRWFYQQKWVLGTSGNFSAVLSREPFRMLITARGVHKGTMAPENFLQVDSDGNAVNGKQRPSAETLIHLAIISEVNAGAILHTHSVWATILSEAHAASGGLTIQGYEMLKGLSGVKTHEHQEWLPILENSQDYHALSQSVSHVLRERSTVHGILLRNHGLYTWGCDIEEAKRHVEIFEFLLEVIGCQQTTTSSIL